MTAVNYILSPSAINHSFQVEFFLSDDLILKTGDHLLFQ